MSKKSIPMRSAAEKRSDGASAIKAQKPTVNDSGAPKTHAAAAPAPLELGVTLALVIGSPDVVIHARTALEYSAAHATNRCGITMAEECQVLALHAGGARVGEQARRYAELSCKDHDETNPNIKAIGTHQSFNWCSIEGTTALQPYLNKRPNALITIAQRIHAPLSPEFGQVVTKMDAVARAASTRVLLFVNVAHRRDADLLNHVTCERLEIEACEPGPGAIIAFSIKFSGIDLLYPLGLGARMCEIKARGQRYGRSFTKFVASGLEDRTIWMCRSDGKTYEEIAKLFGIPHRSTVMRRLQTLRAPDSEDVPDGWIEKALEMMSLEIPKSPGPAAYGE